MKPGDLEKNGLMQFPAIMGGIVPVYNIKGIGSGQLRFTGPVLAGRRADGKWRWVASYGAPCYSDKGEFMRVLGNDPNITEQAERNKALIELDRRRNELLALVSHELRNPLAAIKNSLGLIKKTPDAFPDIHRRALEVIERQSTQLVRLVEDLRDLQRVTAGKFRISKKFLNLEEVLAQAIETASPDAERANQSIVLQMPFEATFVKGDEVRLCQVFANLINNASKFSPPGSKISLKVSASTDEVTISVKDNGIGIEKDQLGRIFEMFAQARQHSERSNTGMGLGLALAKELVQLHDGAIEAISDGPGKGSEFIVRLPSVAADVTH